MAEIVVSSLMAVIGTMDTWTDGWMVGQTDGRTDGQTLLYKRDDASKKKKKKKRIRQKAE